LERILKAGQNPPRNEAPIEEEKEGIEEEEGAEEEVEGKEKK
jgi:hypothetical protein